MKKILSYITFVLLSAVNFCQANESLNELPVDTMVPGSAHSEALTNHQEAEIIHYMFVIDNNLGLIGMSTPLSVIQNIDAIREKIKKEQPDAVISSLRHGTYEMNAIDELMGIWQSRPNESMSERDYYEEFLNVLTNIQKSTRTIIFINAHGGGFPYQAGSFKTASSHLIAMKNIEFVFLACTSGNLQLTEDTKSKIFGIGPRNHLSSAVHISNFLKFLSVGEAPVPTSALGFYKYYLKTYNQTPVLLVLASIIPDILPMESEIMLSKLDDVYHAWFNIYIDSVPAKIFEQLTTLIEIPYPTKPWYVDASTGVHYGQKDGYWWTLESEQANYTLEFMVLLVSALLQLSELLQVPGVMPAVESVMLPVYVKALELLAPFIIEVAPSFGSVLLRALMRG